jgi:hypothetical protein
MFRVLRVFYIFFLALPFFLNAQVTTSGLDANDSSSYSGSGNTLKQSLIHLLVHE